MMQVLILIDCVYLVALGAAVYFTRPGTRRIMGALGGGVAAGLSLPLVLAIASAQGWWRCPFLERPQRVAADIHRVRYLLRVDGPDSLVGRAPFRLARNSMVSRRSLRHRRTTRLRDCGVVPRVDGVWTRCRSHRR